jgi:hypothetical protein
MSFPARAFSMLIFVEFGLEAPRSLTSILAIASPSGEVTCPFGSHVPHAESGAKHTRRKMTGARILDQRSTNPNVR